MKKVFHVSILILLSIQNIEENSTYEQNEKKLDLLSLIKSINLTNENSFFSKNFDDNFENNSENGIKIVYLKKDEIPKIQLINKKIMTIDGQYLVIKDYLNQINDYNNKINDNNENSNDLLVDYKYEVCGICENNTNKYFCEDCQKNICDKCYKTCCKEKHKILILENIRAVYENNIEFIKITLAKCIIPIKDKEDKNIINEDCKEQKEENIKKNQVTINEEYNFEDILFINEIISVDYNNYFHYKNIQRILQYCYPIFCRLENYKFEGKGKYIHYDGKYYIGQFKNNIPNGKGTIYYKNGNIFTECEWIDVKKRDMESIFLQMGLIILDYLKMTYQMEKVKYFIKMEILNMMEIG